MKSIKAALALFALGTAVAAGADEFEFRNDDRPDYDRSISVEQLASMQESEKITLIDVRLIEDYEADPTLIPGASHQDPEQITEWYSELPQDSKVVVYCVKGAWVSHKAATFLDQKGIETYTLDGGIRGWKAEQGDSIENR